MIFVVNEIDFIFKENSCVVLEKTVDGGEIIREYEVLSPEEHRLIHLKTHSGTEYYYKYDEHNRIVRMESPSRWSEKRIYKDDFTLEYEIGRAHV